LKKKITTKEGREGRRGEGERGRERERERERQAAQQVKVLAVQL
jgi:hypothetical protein